MDKQIARKEIEDKQIARKEVELILDVISQIDDYSLNEVGIIPIRKEVNRWDPVKCSRCTVYKVHGVYFRNRRVYPAFVNVYLKYQEMLKSEVRRAIKLSIDRLKSLDVENLRHRAIDSMLNRI